MRLAAASIIVVASWAFTIPTPARAWGDEGHVVIGYMAYALLSPAARKQVDALVKADEGELKIKDFPTGTTWADRWRDSDRPDGARYKGTRNWHFVDIAVPNGDLASACFNHPPLPEGKLASEGLADQCVMDKIKQFTAELKDPRTPEAERILALKFLMHFIGDIHQPLHAAEKNKDQGGNKVPVL
jgi:hypothetical protein